MTRRGERGSVLVEAMVGAAIVAITLASMYNAILESASHNRMAEERRYALMVAQSQLAMIGPIIPAVPGVTEGTEGDFNWRVTIEPYGAAAQQMPQLGKVPNPTGTLCLAHVAVSYGRRPPLATIDTLILARGG
jgi:hypothetical protein